MSRVSFAGSILVAVILATGTTHSAAQDEAENHERQRQVMQRFLDVLEKNPRRGTAFDKVYGFHVEWGTLDEFVAGLRERVAKAPDDGPAWMILGLVESQRGHDGAAVDAFSQAEKTLPQNATASYYLGQALVLAGQPDQSVAAFERAIQRQPSPVDLLDIFQSLGRVHQRAHRHKQALEAWNRLEQLFPDDVRVQEQIAVTLVEEGEFAAALPRYEKLAANSKDEYRRAVFRIEASELKARLGSGSEAVADLESLLKQLNPESWLFRDVRRKIEDVFLRIDDLDGLARYYEQWLVQHPQDVDAMSRLAQVLARQARIPESQRWLEKALKLAPSRRDLRLAAIDQLVDDRKFAEALEHYKALDQAEPNNPDLLREWGKLALRDTSRTEQDRQAVAEQIWRRLVTARPKDPLVSTQVADLLRYAGMPQQALELYRQATELAPDQPQFREYLGEFYHHLQRPDEALATWRQIAAGKNRTAENTARLAEVLAGSGYLREALPEIAAACQLDPKDFSLPLQGAELCVKAEMYAEAERYLATAEKLAANPDESELVLARQLRLYQADESLGSRAMQMAEELQAADAPTAQQYFRFARLLEAAQRFPEASAAIRRALELDSKSIPGLASAARIFEQAGELQAAADLSRQLANADRRLRTTYLTHVARLESQLGRSAQALQAGRDLIAAAPGNSENHTFFAQLCFQMGRPDEGLDVLRRAMRANPSDAQVTMSLGQALASHQRSDEALECYWQAFGRSTDLETKLTCVTRLTELYLQADKFERLLERLGRSRNESGSRREAAICLAQAHQSAGDIARARQELESLLDQGTRDTHLLQQLSKLAEDEGDLPAAVQFQEQLVKLTPGSESEFRLASLLARSGGTGEARAILTRLALQEDNPIKVLQNLDNLLEARQFEAVLTITANKLLGSPKNWELIYREGVALAGSHPEEASRRFQAIRALNLNDEEPGAELASSRNKPATPSAISDPVAIPPVLHGKSALLSAQTEIRAAVGFNVAYFPMTATRRTTWTPKTFGAARLASLAWLLRIADTMGVRDEFLAARRNEAEAPNASASNRWDWVFLLQLTDQHAEVVAVARAMAKTGDPDGQSLYLAELERRTRLPVNRAASVNSALKLAPLAQADLELAIQCIHDIISRSAPGSPAVRSLADFVAHVSSELRRAGRDDEAQRIFDKIAEKLSRPEQAALRLREALALKDDEAILEAVDRWLHETKRQLAASHQQSGFTPQAIVDNVLPLMARRGAAKADADVLRLLDGAMDCGAAVRITTQLPPSFSTNVAGMPGFAANQRQSGIFMTLMYGDQWEQIGSYLLNTSYLDVATAQVARNALHIFQRNGTLPKLFQHLEQRASQAAGEQAREYVLLGTLHLWNQDSIGAVESLLKASAAAPNDVPLRIEIAQLLRQQQQFDAALAMLDVSTPQDQGVLRRREMMALDLAERLGNVERGRAAAERLFGARLNPDEVQKVVGPMRRLGLDEMADSLLARNQRQPGKPGSSSSRPSELLVLMQQHVKDGKFELAGQVAQHILRTRPNSTGSGRVDPLRNAALQTLRQSGQLNGLIARLERQLESSPDSTPLMETLLEYYTVAGEREKAVRLDAKLLGPTLDDPLQRYQFAERLARSGKFAEACDHFLAAIQRDPQLLQRNTMSLLQTFQQARREAELAKLLAGLDLTAFPYLTIFQIIQRQNGDAAVALFRNAWKAFPDQRETLLNIARIDDVWALPEVVDFLQNTIIPTPEQLRQDPWIGVRTLPLFGSAGGVFAFTGQPPSRASRQTLRTDQATLGKLRDAIGAAAEQQPAWHGGKLLVAILNLRLGRITEAKVALESSLRDFSEIPPDVALVVAQETSPFNQLGEISIRLFEQSERNSGLSTSQKLNQLPRLYAMHGRREDARKMLLEMLPEPQEEIAATDPNALQIQLQTMRQVSTQLANLGFHVDSLRAVRQMFVIDDLLRTKGYDGVLYSDPFGTTDPSLSATKSILESSIKNLVNAPSLKPLNKEPSLKPFLASSADETIGELLKFTTPRGNTPATLDLLVVSNRAPAGFLICQSLLLQVLGKIEESNEVATQEVDKVLQESKQQYPDDLNLRIVAGVWALRSKDPEQWKAAASDLWSLVERTPLEPIPAGERPTAPQRIDASRQIGLWFAASEFLKHEPVRDVGDRLAERAVAAAERLSDRGYALAMLHDWGSQAAETGDKQAAEQRWSKLIDLIIAGPHADPPVLAPPGRSTIRPLTDSQFSQVLRVAELSAATVPSVSLRAMSLALAGGPPVPNLTTSMPGGAPSPSPAMRTTSKGFAAGGGESTAGVDSRSRVRLAVQKVSGIWAKASVPPDQVYAALQPIVFCPGRPQEIWLYESAPTSNNRARTSMAMITPQSIGELLVSAAVSAGRTEDLKREISTRQQFPQAELPALVLLFQLHHATGDRPAAIDNLRAIDQLLQQKPIPSHINLSSHAALPGWSDPELYPAVFPLLERIAKNWGSKPPAPP